MFYLLQVLFFSGDKAAVSESVMERTKSMKTLEELEPFCDLKKGGGLKVHDTNAWRALERWNSLKENCSKQELHTVEAKVAHYWAGTTDIGAGFIDTLLDHSKDMRTRKKAYSSIQMQKTAHRDWQEDKDTPHAIGWFNMSFYV